MYFSQTLSGDLMNIKHLAITLLCVASLLSLPACGGRKQKQATDNDTELVATKHENNQDMLVADDNSFNTDDAEITIVLEEEKHSSTLKF